MAEQTGGHISQGSATLAGRACFVTILWKISGSAWLELEVSKKMDGRTITGTITKRYPKVARRCLGPPLAQLLAFEALFYNACICLLAVTTSLKPDTQQWRCGASHNACACCRKPSTQPSQCGNCLLAHAYHNQSYLSETFCAAIARRELYVWAYTSNPSCQTCAGLLTEIGDCAKVSRLEFRCFRKHRTYACMTSKNRAWRIACVQKHFLYCGASLHPKYSKPCKTIGDSLNNQRLGDK